MALAKVVGRKVPPGTATGRAAGALKATGRKAAPKAAAPKAAKAVDFKPVPKAAASAAAKAPARRAARAMPQGRATPQGSAHGRADGEPEATPTRDVRRLDELTRSIAAIIAKVDEVAREHGLSPEKVVTAVAAAARNPRDVVLDASPRAAAAERLTLELGPYLTGRAMERRAGITRQGLAVRRKRWAVIGVPTDDPSTPILYPVAQFAEPASATVLRGVREGARALAAGINDPLTIATWFARPNPDLSNRTAYSWLRDGGDVATVVRAATRDATRWQS